MIAPAKDGLVVPDEMDPRGEPLMESLAHRRSILGIIVGA